MLNRRNALVLALLPSSACIGSWEDDTGYEAVWAEDDSEVAVVTVEYEQHYIGGKPGRSRDHRYHIDLVDPKTRERRVLVEGYRPGGFEPEWPKASYMKAAGYVLVSFGNVAYQHWLDGEVAEVPISALSPERGVVRLTPSPDGSLIAVKDYGPLQGDDRVGLLYANDLSVAVPPKDFGRTYLHTRWTPDGRLVIRGHDGYSENETYFELSPEGDVIERDEPACDEGPSTASSDLSSDGLRVRVDYGTAEILFEDRADLTVFGCNG